LRLKTNIRGTEDQNSNTEKILVPFPIPLPRKPIPFLIAVGHRRVVG